MCRAAHECGKGGGDTVCNTLVCPTLPEHVAQSSHILHVQVFACDSFGSAAALSVKFGWVMPVVGLWHSRSMCSCCLSL
jgi:hypothetical protein